jgi:hypothetical protein
MVGIFFCIASIGLGTSIMLYFPRFERIEEKLTLGLILGFALTTWITFLFSLLYKTLDIGLIISVSLAALLSSFLLLLHYPRTKYHLIIKPSKTYLTSMALFSILFILVNLNTIKSDSQGNLRAMLTAWADYPLHLTYIINFSEKIPLRLSHPLLINHKLIYPFLIDFLSAIMYKSGLDYITSIVLINIILSIGLISIIYLFTKEFTRSEIAGLFVLFLFFLNGNFGFFFALGNRPEEIFLANSFYTKMDPKGLIWGNTLSVLFLSQRTFIWGMAIAAIIYLIFLKGFFRTEHTDSISRQNLFLAGILLGMLPLIHTPSFLAVVFVSLFFFLFRLKKDWLYFILPSVSLAMPQIFYLLQERSLTKALFWFQPGWMLKSANPVLILFFWIYNLGIILFLLVAGVFLIDKRKVFFYLPFILIFLIGNFVMIHPYDWDNTKYFLHWFFLSCVIASLSLVYILNHGQRWKKPDRLFLVIILVFFSLFSGLIDYICLNRVSFVLADKKAQGIAEWVRKNTPFSSLLLTSDTHSHPVSMLGGRNIVMGYRGWLWSHGYDYKELEQDVQKIYRSADLNLINKYKITHIVISPYEKELHPNLNLFLRSEHFKEIYKTKTDSGMLRIFEVTY